MTLGEDQKTVKALNLSQNDRAAASEAAGFDRPELLEGRLPEKQNECALDAKLQTAVDVAVGDTVTLTPGEAMADALSEDTYTVTGIVNSPRYISLDRGHQHPGGRQRQRLCPAAPGELCPGVLHRL